MALIGRPSMNRGSLLLSFVLAPTLFAQPALAKDGFRCGNRLVTQGDPMLEVRKKCGDPDFVTQRTERRTVKAKVRHFTNGQVVEAGEEETTEILLDEWTYHLGPLP